MKFMPFDLDHHLKLYNLSSPTPKTRQDFDFLQALNENSTTTLALATELLHKSAHLGAQLSTDTRISLFDDVVSQMNSRNYQGVRLSLKKLAQLIEADNLQSWYIEQHRRLSSPDLWEQINTSSMTKNVKTQIVNLKGQWTSAQAKYSAHSVSALCFSAETIVRLLENYYYFSRVEYRIHRHRIPKMLRKAYKEYLINAQERLSELKQDFCQNMLLRLQLAAASGDISYNDHIHYTGEFLDKHKLIKQQRGLPSYRRTDLSSKHFQLFLRYIIRSGTETQKEALKKISVFSNDENYVGWQNEETMILTPKPFYDKGLVPQSPPWLPSLFKQRYFRYHFMEKNVWLLSSLRLLEKKPLADRDIAYTLKHLKEIEAKLEQANQEIETNTVSGISRLFQYSTLLFKHEWSQYFQETQTMLLKFKIAFVTSVHHDLSRHNATFLEQNPLTKTLDEVTASLSKIHLPAQQCESFFMVKAALLSKQSSAACRLTPTENPRRTSNNPFDRSVSDSASTPSTNPFDPPPKEASSLEKVDTTLFDLLNNLRLMELDLANFQEMMSSITKAMTLLSQTKLPKEAKLLKQALDKIFTQYLKKYASLSSFSDYEKYHEKFLSIEQLLLAFSDDHIRTRIQSIIDCRQQPQYWFFVQLKCRSYLASYQPKIAPYLIANSVVLNDKGPSRDNEPTIPQTIQLQ